MFENWDNNPVVVFLKEQWDKLKNFFTTTIDLCFGNRGKSRNINKKGDRSEVESDPEEKKSSLSIKGVDQSPQKKESPTPLTQISGPAPKQLLASPTSPARPLAQTSEPATARPPAQTSEPAQEQPPASPARPLAQEQPPASPASPVRPTHQKLSSEKKLYSEENLKKLSGNSMFSPDDGIAVPLLSNLKKNELQIIEYRETLHKYLENESGDDFLGNVKKLTVVLFGDDFLNSAIQSEDLKFNGIFFHKEAEGNKEIWMKEGCENEIKDLFNAFIRENLTDIKIKQSAEALQKISDESKTSNKLSDNVGSLSPIGNVGSIFFSYLPSKIDEAKKIKRITSLQSGGQSR